MQYGHLVDIGRSIVDERVPRPRRPRSAARWLLKEGLTLAAVQAGAEGRPAACAPLLPAALKNKVPPPAPAARTAGRSASIARKVLLLLGCVQPAMAPNINSATARVLDAAGIQTLVAPKTPAAAARSACT